MCAPFSASNNQLSDKRRARFTEGQASEIVSGPMTCDPLAGQPGIGLSKSTRSLKTPLASGLCSAGTGILLTHPALRKIAADRAVMGMAASGHSRARRRPHCRQSGALSSGLFAWVNLSRSTFCTYG